MAPRVRLIILLQISLSLAGTSESVPARGGLGGWTLNSAGYLLGPRAHLSKMADSATKRERALEILDLCKALDGLPYSSPQGPVKRTPSGTFSKPEIGDVSMLSRRAPKEEYPLRS